MASGVLAPPPPPPGVYLEALERELEVLTFPDTRVTCRTSGGAESVREAAATVVFLDGAARPARSVPTFLVVRILDDFVELGGAGAFLEDILVLAAICSVLQEEALFLVGGTGGAGGHEDAQRRTVNALVFLPMMIASHVPLSTVVVFFFSGGIRLGAKSSSSSSSSSSAGRADAVFVLFSLLPSKATLSIASPEDLAL